MKWKVHDAFHHVTWEWTLRKFPCWQIHLTLNWRCCSELFICSLSLSPVYYISSFLSVCSTLKVDVALLSVREKWGTKRTISSSSLLLHTHLFHLLEHIAYEWWKISQPFPSHFFFPARCWCLFFLFHHHHTAHNISNVFLFLYTLATAMRNIFSIFILNNTDGKSFLMKEILHSLLFLLTR